MVSTDTGSHHYSSDPWSPKAPVPQDGFVRPLRQPRVLLGAAQEALPLSSERHAGRLALRLAVSLGFTVLVRHVVAVLLDRRSHPASEVHPSAIYLALHIV